MYWVFWGIIALWLGLWPLYVAVALLVFLFKIFQQAKRDYQLLSAKTEEPMPLNIRLEIHHYYHSDDEGRYITIDQSR